ncbi:hypothetical protein JCM24511_10032 [Saitozyma sp. JCM 24511]|nr:hypothetical protein JCM24511_10032 [Saitozyma sp. JCM 24511]
MGRSCGPLMFSLGIRSLLRDLASTLGPDRLILAYLDDIYILSQDDWALEQTLAFFDERQPSIRLNPTKCKMLALEDIRTDGHKLGTCVGARSAREQFLQEQIDHEAATVTKLINLPHQHALLVLRATGLVNPEYGLTVVSLASKESRDTSLPEQEDNPSRLVNQYLDCVAVHNVRHRPTSNLPFHPIIFSLGGMMNGSTTKFFASWKRAMTGGTYNLILKRLSLCLMQARVRSF